MRPKRLFPVALTLAVFLSGCTTTADVESAVPTPQTVEPTPAPAAQPTVPDANVDPTTGADPNTADPAKDEERAFFTEDELTGDPDNWSTDPCTIKTRADIEGVAIDNWILPDTRELFLDDVLACMSDDELTAFTDEDVLVLTDGGNGLVETCMVPKLGDRATREEIAQFFLIPENHPDLGAPRAVFGPLEECAAAADLGQRVIRYLSDTTETGASTQECIRSEIVPAFVDRVYNDNGVRGRFGVTGDEFNEASATAAQRCLTPAEVQPLAGFVLPRTFPEATLEMVTCLGERLRKHPEAMYQTMYPNGAAPSASPNGYFYNAIDCATPEYGIVALAERRIPDLNDPAALGCLESEIAGKTQLLTNALVGDGADRDEFGDLLRRCLTDADVAAILG